MTNETGLPHLRGFLTGRLTSDSLGVASTGGQQRPATVLQG